MQTSPGRFQFLHVADPHIDSPLKNLRAYPGAPLDELQAVTRTAFENAVSLALDEQVALVVVAGDLFDGPWKHMETGVWTAHQFRRLDRAGIPVFLVRGNHDAASRVTQGITWPENVHWLSVTQPETVTLDEHRLAIHGQGFGEGAIDTDLAAGYPDPVPGYFNLGILHTSLAGNPQHDCYAPTSEQVLKNKGYDYWALGHIHQRRTIRQQPYIAYAGNPQGRHVRETGEKGCLLATVEAGQLTGVEFRPTDVLRWYHLHVELAAEHTLQDVYRLLRSELEQCVQASAGRLSAIRVELQGACQAHQELIHPAGREQAIEEIRNLGNEVDESIWIESVVLETDLPLDLDQLRAGHDLVGELLRDCEAIADDEDALLELAEELEPLTSKAPGELDEAGVAVSSGPEQLAQLRTWLRQTERMLVARLREAAS